MATLTPTPSPTPDPPIRLIRPVEAPAAGPLAGVPAMVALPSFIVGAVAFGMVLIGSCRPGRSALRFRSS